ncbi:MAG: D-alanine--D-alanine ligase [Desulfosoma sp.]
MKIGLTYDLRDVYLAEGFSEEETAEFDRPDTIEALETVIRALGHETDRIGRLKDLMQRLVSGDRWDLVFNIAEGLLGSGREAQVPALLDAYGIPYTFSDPLSLCVTLDKSVAKRLVRDAGLPTAPFVVVGDLEDVGRVDLPMPLFAKPVREGTGKGITTASKIQSLEQLERVCVFLLETYDQPVLVETFLPGREFTVGLLGSGKSTRALGVMEVVLRENADAEVYSYANKEWCEERVLYRLADDEEARQAARVAVESWKVLGCRDAGRIDLRSDGRGRPHFLEANPLAGLHPEHSDLPILCTLLGIPYRDLIGAVLNEAIQRMVRGGKAPEKSLHREALDSRSIHEGRLSCGL